MATPPKTHAGGTSDLDLSPQASTPIKRGIVVSRRLPDDADLRYYLYIPEAVSGDVPLLVTVHGISRNAREHARAFVALAERRGVVVLSPVFKKKRFPDYQRLGRAGKGERADLALRRMIDDARRLIGAGTGSLYLYGHSGGAQFVHRYVMAYPEDVAHYAVSAAGWYTLPDAGLKYPEGARLGRQLPGVTFDLTKFLRVPACVMVGERDRRRDSSLNRSATIDARLGKTRVERARKWVATVTEAARRRNLGTRFTLHLLPGTGHDFTENVADSNLTAIVSDCLFGRGN